jgi:hypothetical protein
MNRRTRRIAFVSAGAGALVIAGLVAWSTVRDHAEAWWFEATRSTRTLTPQGIPPTESMVELTPEYLIQCIANYSGRSVVFDPDSLGNRFSFKGHRLPRARPQPFWYFRRDVHWLAASPPDFMLRILEEKWRLRVLDQSFPRRAYVVVGYPSLDEWVELSEP